MRERCTTLSRPLPTQMAPPLQGAKILDLETASGLFGESYNKLLSRGILQHDTILVGSELPVVDRP